MYSKTFDWEFSYIEILITDKSSQPLDIDDRINITLVITEVENDTLYSSTMRFVYKAMDFCLLLEIWVKI